MKPDRAISFIEAAYRIDLSTEQWLKQLAAAGSKALEPSEGTIAFTYDASDGTYTHVRAATIHGFSPRFAHDFFHQETSAEANQALAELFKTIRCQSMRVMIERLGVADTFGATLDRHGIQDMLGVNGLDPAGRGCVLFIAQQQHVRSTRMTHLWSRLAAHASAGNRLRSRLLSDTGAVHDPTQRAEAILSTNGKIEHATGLAESIEARAALRDALVRIDAARAEMSEAERSVNLWRGLVAGRWSLVEHFERDGRRYYLAHKNDPELAPDRGLTLREKQVLGYAELGYSNKLIAYSLGLSASTVGTLLTKARRKVGIT